MKPSKLITISILQDSLEEPNEELFVTLSDADGADISDAKTKIIIIANDQPGFSIAKYAPIYYLLLFGDESILIDEQPACG